MSWTSEHEPPPPRPPIETDDPADFGFEVVADPGDGDGDPGWADQEDEGPLDPSVFDGLFADLADPDPSPSAVVTTADQPVEPAGIVAFDLDPEPVEVDQPPGADDPVDDILLNGHDSDEKRSDTNGSNGVNGHHRAALVEAVADFDQPDDLPRPDGPYSPAVTLEDAGHHTPGFEHQQDSGRQQEPGDEHDRLDLIPMAFNGSTTMPGLEPEVPAAVGIGEDRVALLDHGPAGRTNDIYEGPEDYRPPPLLDPTAPTSSPPIQPDPPPTESPALRTGDEAEQEAMPILRPSVDRQPRSRSRWRAFGLATAIGALLGIGGAFVLAQVLNRDSPSVDTTVLSNPTEDSSDATDPAGATVATSGAVELGPVDRLELSSLRFEPGTVRLTEGSEGALDLLTQAIEQDGEAPIAVTVRTYTERSTSDDLALSVAQAQSLADELVEQGADPDRLVVTGMGRSLLTVAQPVPNFVIASAGLQMSPLRAILDDISPFAIGLDSISAQLRPESRRPLARIGEALQADTQNRSITLSAYSFGETDAGSNRGAAGAAAEAAADYLTSNYGIDGSRINILVLGEAPYAVTPETGNHISLRWGDLAAGSLALDDVPVDEIDFAPGSTTLSTSGAAILDGLLEAMVGTELAVVVDVHSYDGPDDEANYQLSRARAGAVSQYLTDTGLPANRLRTYGRGNRPQFRSEETVARVVVSFVPWAG